MIGRVLPRYLILVATLTLVVVGLMLTLFYGQYRWLTADIVSSSVEEHNAIVERSFEGRSRSQLHRIADSIAAVTGTESISALLEDAARQDDELVGLRYVRPEMPDLRVGDMSQEAPNQPTSWQADNLYLNYPVLQGDNSIGVLVGNFSLIQLRRESAAFRDEIVATGIERRRISYTRVGIATLLVLTLCGIVIWLIVRAQASRDIVVLFSFLRMLLNTSARSPSSSP